MDLRVIYGMNDAKQKEGIILCKFLENENLSS